MGNKNLEAARKMLTVNGRPHSTLADAAKEFGVSPKTIREWIRRGVIPRPPAVAYGIRTLDVFPSSYLKRARVALAEYRSKNGPA